MKLLPASIALLFLAGCAAASKEPLHDSPTSAPDFSLQRSMLVGAYYSPPPCSHGNEVELSLRDDDSYEMLVILPEGVGPQMPDGQQAVFQTVGKWHFDGVAVILAPGAHDQKVQKFVPERVNGHLVLSDGSDLFTRLEKQPPSRDHL